jgi:phosphothreonine lyase
MLKLAIGTGSQASASMADVPMNANRQLENDEAAIAEYLKATSPRDIQRDSSPPSLATVREHGHEATHFSTSNPGDDFFITATSKGDAGKSTFDKHKVHFSVDKEQFDEAYKALAPLLFSEESPIHRFKLTDMERAAASPQSPASDRVTQGAQFTLYLKSNPQTGHYDAQHMHALKSFIDQCENELDKAGMSSGKLPTTDVPLGKYASYRDEKYERDAQNVEKMASEPMGTLLSTRLPSALRSEAD